MSELDKEPKAEPEPGQDVQLGKGEKPPELGKDVKPPTDKVEGDETWEQRAKTAEGLLKQANTNLAELKKTHLDFGGLKQSVEGLSNLVTQQGETLVLHTDILSEAVGQSEELQERVNKVKVRQAEAATRIQAGQTALTEISDTLTIVGLDLHSKDEELSPIQEVFRSGNYPEALKLTKAFVKGRVATLSKPAGEDEGEKDKDKTKQPAVITNTPGAATDWGNLPPKEKVRIGLEEAKKKQQ